MKFKLDTNKSKKCVLFTVVYRSFTEEVISNQENYKNLGTMIYFP